MTHDTVDFFFTFFFVSYKVWTYRCGERYNELIKWATSFNDMKTSIQTKHDAELRSYLFSDYAMLSLETCTKFMKSTDVMRLHNKE